jgi:hypothetical protein
VTEHVVGALLVREGSYAVQVVLAHQLLPGARIEPFALIQGDVIKPLALASDAIMLSVLGFIPPWIRTFQVMQHD